MLPKMPVEMTFDPWGNPGTEPLWSIPAGRLLWLLWRPTHACTGDWIPLALRIARAIDARQPQTIDQLRECFRPGMTFEGTTPSRDFTREAVDVFCVEAIDFFTGEEDVRYFGEVSGVASIRQ